MTATGVTADSSTSGVLALSLGGAIGTPASVSLNSAATNGLFASEVKSTPVPALPWRSLIESILTVSPPSELIPQVSLESVGCTVIIERLEIFVIPTPSVTNGIGVPYTPPSENEALEYQLPVLRSTPISNLTGSVLA